MRFGGIFDYANKKERLQEVELELGEPSVWDNPEKAQALGKERASLESVVATIEGLDAGLHDATELLDMALEEQDADTVALVESDLAGLEERLAELEFRRMFSGEMDPNNAFLDIQAGSGGTEAQDWAEMLMRMYLKWGDRKGFKAEVLEVSAGDVAGIKGATIRFEGEYAFGWLRTETGVHRLVRKSPFDSNNGRHTSFSSIFVSPEVDDNIDIVINPADLRVDTYRSSGAGGQHVNKTDSAVRITHAPSGIVVQCQNERSQIKNREVAIRMLKAKVRQHYKELEEKERQDKMADKKKIEWGSQIRSYVLHPYNMVKDHRTDYETSNTQAVLDGEIDEFIEKYLLAF